MAPTLQKIILGFFNPPSYIWLAWVSAPLEVIWDSSKAECLAYQKSLSNTILAFGAGCQLRLQVKLSAPTSP